MNSDCNNNTLFNTNINKLPSKTDICNITLLLFNECITLYKNNKLSNKEIGECYFLKEFYKKCIINNI